MATAIRKKIQVSKKKLKASVKKAKAFVKKPKNRKYIIIAVVLVVLFIAWQKFGKRGTVVNPSNPGGKDGTPIPGGSTAQPGTPGSVLPYPVGNGIMSPKLADFSYPEHINFLVTGTSKAWTCTDLSTVTAPEGYSIRYYADTGEEIITKTPLSNYVWESNFPLTFEKCLIKDGVNDLYFWGTTDNALRRVDDGRTMSGNVSIAYQTFYFNRL